MMSCRGNWRPPPARLTPSGISRCCDFHCPSAARRDSPRTTSWARRPPVSPPAGSRPASSPSGGTPRPAAGSLRRRACTSSGCGRVGWRAAAPSWEPGRCCSSDNRPASPGSGPHAVSVCGASIHRLPWTRRTELSTQVHSPPGWAWVFLPNIPGRGVFRHANVGITQQFSLRRRAAQATIVLVHRVAYEGG